MDKPVTNSEFTKTDQTFINACKKVEIPPTGRQAGKWRRRTGLAWKEGR